MSNNSTISRAIASHNTDLKKKFDNDAAAQTKQQDSNKPRQPEPSIKMVGQPSTDQQSAEQVFDGVIKQALDQQAVQQTFKQVLSQALEPQPDHADMAFTNLSVLLDKLTNKSTTPQTNNLSTALETVPIVDDGLKLSGQAIQDELTSFEQGLLSSNSLNVQQQMQAGTQSQNKIVNHVLNYATNNGYSNFGSLTAMSSGSSATSLYALISNMEGGAGKNILFLAMLAFLAVTDIDANLIQANTVQMTLNSDRRKRLDNAQSAFQAFSGIIPYTKGSSNPVENMYQLFQYAYVDKDSSAQAGVDGIRKICEGIKDPTNSDGKTYLQELEENNWSDSSVNLFNDMIGSMFNNINTDLNAIGSTTVTPFDKATFPVGSTGQDETTYKVEPARLNDILSKIQSGANAAGNSSQIQMTLLQNSQQVYQQHFQAAINSLQVAGKISDYIYSRL